MRKLIGWIAFLAGAWMLVSPQALIGLKQLRWMHQYAFTGEVLLGIPVLALGYYLLDFRAAEKKASPGKSAETTR